MSAVAKRELEALAVEAEREAVRHKQYVTEHDGAEDCDVADGHWMALTSFAKTIRARIAALDTNPHPHPPGNDGEGK